MLKGIGNYHDDKKNYYLIVFCGVKLGCGYHKPYHFLLFP